MGELSQTVRIVNAKGLHARASAKFVNTVAKLPDGTSVTVRKDGTIRLDNRLYEVDPTLRGLDIQICFDPWTRARIEVSHRGQSFGLAKLVDLHLNSQITGSSHYVER